MTVPALAGEGFRLRRLAEADLPYVVALGRAEAVEPFLAAVSPWAEEEVRADLARAAAESERYGRFVLEAGEAGGWRPAGALAFEVSNRRSRIARLYGVMVDPAVRGRGLGEAAVRLVVRHLVRELGYHRVQLEVYGFNETALRLFERAGFTREGRKRKAYWRSGEWVDGVTFGLVEEDLAG